MPCVDLYDGKTDPNTSVMSFETAIQSARGDNRTMSKAFILVVTGITKTWYATQPPGSVYSWQQLREQMGSNFQGNYDDPITFADLYAMRQGPKDSLRSYVRHFIHVKCQASGLSEQSIIDAAKDRLRPGPLWSRMSRKPFTNVKDLLQNMEEYAREEDDDVRSAGREGGKERSDRTSKGDRECRDWGRGREDSHRAERPRRQESPGCADTKMLTLLEQGNREEDGEGGEEGANPLGREPRFLNTRGRGRRKKAERPPPFLRHSRAFRGPHDPSMPHGGSPKGRGVRDPHGSGVNHTSLHRRAAAPTSRMASTHRSRMES